MTVEAASPNAAQAENWNTAVGVTWVDYQAQLDRQLDVLGQAAMRALAPAPGERILDIGCGCGHTSLQLAECVGAAGSVLGLDISAIMLDVARRRAVTATGGRIEFREADVQVSDLGRGLFDAAYSRFGVMFFSDPVAAFANLRDALKPNGRIGFVCWRPLAENPWMREPFEAARPLLPTTPPPDPLAPGPFAFADPERVARAAPQGGLHDGHDRTVRLRHRRRRPGRDAGTHVTGRSLWASRCVNGRTCGMAWPPALREPWRRT